MSEVKNVYQEWYCEGTLVASWSEFLVSYNSGIVNVKPDIPPCFKTFLDDIWGEKRLSEMLLREGK